MSRTLSRRKSEGVISLETPQWKRVSSRFKGRISWFFSSGGRNLGGPLDLQWGPQESTCVTSGKSSLNASCEGPFGIPLQSVKGPMSTSRVEAGTSVFLSSADLDLGVPTEFQQRSQALSCVKTWNSVFLSGYQRCVRIPVTLTWGSGAISQDAPGLSHLLLCFE